MKIAYKTKEGTCIQGKAESVFGAPRWASRHKGKVDLIFTSPPFPLNTKKRYGNLTGEEYVEWMAGFAPICRELLKPKGSVVIEVGNSWEPGSPTMSTLALRTLLEFLKRGGFKLCQQFIYYNPARLPGPAQWVNVERIRVKDAYTHLWWMAKSERPRASNRRILTEYSESMQQLLRSKKYNSGNRPSEHRVGTKSFLANNGGAIPSNVIQLSNTGAFSDYLRYCRKRGLQPHPARMPIGLPEFFIRFLTTPGNLVLDPFAGSNTTGAAAEHLGRRWISIEADRQYIAGSRGRFRVRKKRKKAPTERGKK